MARGEQLGRRGCRAARRERTIRRHPRIDEGHEERAHGGETPTTERLRLEEGEGIGSVIENQMLTGVPRLGLTNKEKRKIEVRG